jgi:hypothetical protein
MQEVPRQRCGFPVVRKAVVVAAMLTAATSCDGGSGLGISGDSGEAGGSGVREGFVSVGSGRRRSGENDDQVHVTWGAVFDESNPACRTVATFFPCMLLACGVDEARTRRATAPHAGAIAVTGTRSPIMLVPADDGRYALVDRVSTALFVGGETVVVSAAGAEVPGFSLSTAAPLPLPLTAPRLALNPSQGAAPVSAARPLTFSWESTVAGDLSVSLAPVAATGADRDGFLFCSLRISRGAGQIPAEALQAARARLGARLLLVAHVRGTATAVAHGWRASLAVATDALIPVEGASEATPEVEILLE